MVKRITITNYDCWNTNFHTNDNEIHSISPQHCEYCGFAINRGYSFIIDNLKEAGLLVEDYKKICCYCYLLMDYGLMDIRKYLQGVHYNKVSDILHIDFSFEKDGAVITHDDILCFAIHDYKKLKIINDMINKQ